MAIHAPYNFVALSRFIYEPDWADRISHDVPFSDGLSGEFDITITARSKILIGGERGEENGIRTVEPSKLPDGTYAIPESSIRGMIRNVLEIAAFSRMQFVDDKRFGIRDLTDPAIPYYRRRIVNKVKTGWLWFDGAAARQGEPGWRITPCSMARVRFEELAEIGKASRIAKPIAWSTKGDAPERYKLWGLENTRQTLVLYEGEREKLARLPGPGERGEAGHLVFTGNPGVQKDFKKAKKAEFFFYDLRADAEALSVPQLVFEGFKTIHDPEDGRPKNPAWIYWHDLWAKRPATRIPVFYIVENREVASFGLASMFKLAHAMSVAQIIAHTSDKHCQPDVIDLPTALFGYAADKGEQGPRGLKSRIHLGLAKCISDGTGRQPKCLSDPQTILSGPKPSYFPSYVRQPVEKDDSGRLKRVQNAGRAVYATYTPLPGEQETELRQPEIRGWKRYPAGRKDKVNPVTDPKTKKEVQVILKPLPSGVRFTSTVRFHNLRPTELGALLWALEWDGRPELRHRLGMGKPYGYGQITITVNDGKWTLRRNSNTEESNPSLSKRQYMDVFIAEMESAYRKAAKEEGRTAYDCASWATSEQIAQLLAMADPNIGQRQILDYMRLQVPGENQFVLAKNAHEALPDYLPADHSDPRETEVWPRAVRPVRREAPPTAKGMAGSRNDLGLGDTVTWLDEQIDAKVVSIDGGFAVIALSDGGQERVPLRSLRRPAEPPSTPNRRR